MERTEYALMLLNYSVILLLLAFRFLVSCIPFLLFLVLFLWLFVRPLISRIVRKQRDIIHIFLEIPANSIKDNQVRITMIV